MAVLLVGMSVAAVLITVAMPAWHQMVQREREAELIFRGQQYVRAIGLFQKKSGPGVLPPNIDVLVTGRFLRKKFKDPITNQDFDVLSPQTAAGTPPPAQGRGQQPTTSGFQPTGSVIGGQQPSTQGRGAQAGGAQGGVAGVVSKSKDASIRLYNGRTHYNEWQFLFVQQQQPQAPAGGAAGRGAPPVGVGGQGAGRQGFPPPPVGGIQSGQGRQGQGRGNTPAAPQGGRGGPASPASPSIFQPRR